MFVLEIMDVELENIITAIIIAKLNMKKVKNVKTINIEYNLRLQN
jgi:hypothetical protein